MMMMIITFHVIPSYYWKLTLFLLFEYGSQKLNLLIALTPAIVADAVHRF